jgi:hypothetical protein
LLGPDFGAAVLGSENKRLGRGERGRVLMRRGPILQSHEDRAFFCRPALLTSFI